MLISMALFMYGAARKKTACKLLCSPEELFSSIKVLLENPSSNGAREKLYSKVRESTRLFPVVQRIAAHESITIEDAFILYALGTHELWHNELVAKDSDGLLPAHIVNCFVFPARMNKDFIRVYTSVGPINTVYDGPSELQGLFVEPYELAAVHWGIPFMNITESECNELKDKNRLLVQNMSSLAREE